MYNFAFCHDNISLSLINGNSSVKIRHIWRCHYFGCTLYIIIYANKWITKKERLEKWEKGNRKFVKFCFLGHWLLMSWMLTALFTNMRTLKVKSRLHNCVFPCCQSQLRSQETNLETQKHPKRIQIHQSQITNHDLLNPIK